MNILGSLIGLRTRYFPNALRAICANGIFLGILAGPILAAETAPYYFSTYTGISSVGNADGSGDAARFNKPTSLSLDAQGNIYVADAGNKSVRKITPAGVVTTVAGQAGDARSVDGPVAQARFTAVDCVAVDAQGAIYVADRTVLRRISTDGQVTTLAGDAAAVQGGSWVDGVGSAARFLDLTWLAITPDGALLVRDAGVFRRVTISGAVTTVDKPSQSWDNTGFAVDAAGAVYLNYNSTIMKYSASGTVTTIAGSPGLRGAVDGLGEAARFDTVAVVAVGVDGTIYVTDTDNHAIRTITAAGQVTTLAGRLHPSSDSYESRIGAQDGSGAAASFNNPRGLVVDRAGNIYVADRDNNTIRKVTPQGVVTTIAGLAPSRAAGFVDGDLAKARFNHPSGIAVTADGICYVADSANHVIRQISSAGVVSTLAGAPGQSGYADGVGSAAKFNQPHDLAIDKAGNVYALEANSTVRKITPTGIVTTVAGNGLATTESITGQKTPNAIENFKTNCIAVANNGDVYVSESGVINYTNYLYYYTYPHRLLKIAPSGVVTVEIDSSDPHGSGIEGVAIGPDGVIYYCIPYYQSVYKKKPGQEVERLFFTDFAPTSIAVSSTNRIFLTDGYTYGWARIAELQADGSLTIMGGRQNQPAHADGVGTNALFNGLASIAVDGRDTLYLAGEDHTIRIGSLATKPTIRTQPQNQTVVEGGEIQFTVTAAAVPEPTYQWFLNGAAINGATVATYRFTHARPTDAGDYSVTVSNELGTTSSAKATLTVTAAPAPSSGDGTSGGGAISSWLFGALTLLGVFRLVYSGDAAAGKENPEKSGCR